MAEIDKVKQIIIIRKDLNMRKGKMIAMGCHASMKFLIAKNSHKPGDEVFGWLNSTEKEWLGNGKFTKIVAGVDSEKELLDLYDQAAAANIVVERVDDEGCTEFHGVKTLTAICLGPDYSSRLDPITGHLKLL